MGNRRGATQNAQCVQRRAASAVQMAGRRQRSGKAVFVRQRRVVQVTNVGKAGMGGAVVMGQGVTVVRRHNAARPITNRAMWAAW